VSGRQELILVDAAGDLTRCRLAEIGRALRARVPRGGVAVYAGRRAAPMLGALAGLDGWAGRVELRHPDERAAAPPGEGAVPIGDGWPPAGESAPPEPSVRTDWRIFTSGSTGEPKAVDHTLAALRRPVKPEQVPVRTWGLLYPPTKMAGLQVLLRALDGGDAVADPTHLGSLADKVAWLAERGVDAISATPSTWRQILQVRASDALRLRQVTLGGEIADQQLLDQLGRRFDARVTHVYASTEAGSVFSVSDGRAGFPLSLLESATGGRNVEVRGGRLHVAASPAGMIDTGDLVEVIGDRVLFRGRAGGQVNVAGVTVVPERVESLLREHPAVAEAVVTARPNAFSGSILTAQVVLARAEPGTLAQELRRMVRDRCGPAWVPARIAVVEAIRLSASGKVVRR
jgi:acyl-CoA synthetase (AMP-forming)/AMP-acid ligase II